MTPGVANGAPGFDRVLEFIIWSSGVTEGFEPDGRGFEPRRFPTGGGKFTPRNFELLVTNVFRRRFGVKTPGVCAVFDRASKCISYTLYYIV